MKKTAKAAAPYAERLLTNPYVQDNLSNASERLREAYGRARKRRVDVSTDEKIRAQIREAAESVRAAAEGLRTGRQKPRRSFAKRALVVVGIGAGAAAAALAASDELRAAVFGSSEEESATAASSDGVGAPEKVATAA
jgi:hypothetical protein